MSARSGPTKVAAVDIGSNAVRLLILDDGEAVRSSELVGLGRGLEGTGRIGQEALDRASQVLERYAAVIRDRDIDDVRAVATAAGRVAANRDELLDRAAAALGVRPEVLSPEQEGVLTFAGATATRAGDERYVVIDVGGASTELIGGIMAGSGAGPIDGSVRTLSLPLGSTSLTEGELPSDPPQPEELSNAIAIVQDQIDDAIRALDDLVAGATLVGVGGTVLTMAAVEIGLPLPAGAPDVTTDGLDGFVLTRPAAEDVFRTLAREALVDRVHNPGLPRSRADIIVGGCCIVVGAMRRMKVHELTVSVADLLDGVATRPSRI